MKDTYFHGTGEDFETPLHGGGYDNMIWTADNPAVAQNYIPATGGGMSSPVDQWSSDSENVSRFYSPHDSMITLLKQMGYGYPIDEELDNTGRYKSFRYKDRPAKMGELREYLRSLGYDPAQDRMLRSRFNNGVQVITPKDFRQMGRLFVGSPHNPLNIYNGEGLGDGLLDPAYHKLNVFDKLKSHGYDGVRIQDHAQSENWGNVGHTSVGLFPETAQKLNWDVLPAPNFDWGDKLAGVYDTPEFQAWREQKIQEPTR